MVNLPAGARLLAEDLDDITDLINTIAGAWATWTPTWTNLTVGAGGAVTARYLKIGKTAFYRVKFTYGTGSTVGSGPRFSLPFTLASGYADAPLGDVYMWDNGVATYRGMARRQSDTAIELIWFPSGGAATLVSATSPHTWGSTDSFYVTGMCETA